MKRFEKGLELMWKARRKVATGLKISGKRGRPKRQKFEAVGLESAVAGLTFNSGNS